MYAFVIPALLRWQSELSCHFQSAILIPRDICLGYGCCFYQICTQYHFKLNLGVYFLRNTFTCNCSYFEPWVVNLSPESNISKNGDKERWNALKLNIYIVMFSKSFMLNFLRTILFLLGIPNHFRNTKLCAEHFVAPIGHTEDFW